MDRFEINKDIVHKAALAEIPGRGDPNTRFVSQIILFSRRGNVLSLLRPHGQIINGKRQSQHWEFPGGTAEEEETFFDAAIREFIEETRITPPPMVAFSLGLEPDPHSERQCAIMTFLAEIDEELSPIVRKKEHVGHLWGNLRQIPNPKSWRIDSFLNRPEINNISTPVFREIVQGREPLIALQHSATPLHPSQSPSWGGPV